MTLAETVLAFLLSVHAATLAHLVLGLPLPPAVILLVLATAVGALGEGGLGDAGGPRSMSGLRGWVTYGTALVLALLLALGGHRVLAAVLVTRLLLLAQVIFLALPHLGFARLPVLVNAQALVIVAAQAGGLVATVAVTGHAVLAVAWLALDQHERWQAPRRSGRLAALRWSTVALIALGVPLTLLPAAPATGIGSYAAARLERHPERYLELSGYVLGGLGLVLLLRRLLRRGSRAATAPVVPEGPETGAGRILPLDDPAGPAEQTPEGPRGHVIRTYLAFLRRAARSGLPRSPSTTPREHAEALPVAGESLARRFGRARWGAEEIRPADAERADAEARELTRWIKTRPRRPVGPA